ncbi:LysR family transcriptional regulator [Lampropedia aestuarii]|uniref:LysR family transcriptional regulator n=1 Tax=Lampropedia aestuarii TaxID=2562762 RepID=UPI0024698C93|nr:LysR family transcriptional regulator [Lampropedia aestuarii]MDH5858431.1 LysR family transcriptional regulator [Lampropedia aestuarii]
MDKFAALNAFMAVVENGGFAPAARRLGVAPSSLTRQLNMLEKQLSARLMNRSTRMVTLTDAGQQYYEEARRIVDELESADRSICELAGPPSGLLRISMPQAFGWLHIAPVVADFLQQYPDVRLDIQLSDELANLVEDRFDVAIRLGSTVAQNLVARKLAPHTRLLCASPSYLQAHGVPATPADLSRHNCLSFNYGDLSHSSTWSFTCQGKTEKVRVSGNLRANGSEVLRQATIGGVGLAIMPTWLIGQDVSAGRLVRVLQDWQPWVGDSDMGGIWAVYLPNRRGSKKLNAFLDFLSSHFGSPAYWDRCQQPQP